jgi:hypothetical protein
MASANPIVLAAEVDYEHAIMQVLLETAHSYEDRAAVNERFTVHVFRRFLAKSRFSGMLHLFDCFAGQVDDVGMSGLCSAHAFAGVLRSLVRGDDFGPAPPLHAGAEPKLEQVVAFAVELYRSEQLSGSVHYERFAADVGAPPGGDAERDLHRHALCKCARAARRQKHSLYDIFRAEDGDLDGRIALRAANKALLVAGAGAQAGLISDEAVRLADAAAEEDGVVFYELFAERAEALADNRVALQPRGAQMQWPPLSAARLQCALRRINVLIMRQKQLPSSKAVFQGLLDEAEAKGAALGEWNLFYLLREHKAPVQTIEELRAALRDLAQLPKSEAPAAITLVHWLRIV